MLIFLKSNLRWVGTGFLLTFASAFGQTWFISLFASSIKAEHGLTDGAWGSLYTIATLSAAGLMFWRGSVADTIPLSRLAPVMALVFAAACVGMAAAGSLWVLGVSLFLLRFCGQGMFTHIAMTAMGRWFEATRGKAVSFANLGHPASEIVVPLLIVFSIAALGARPVWLGTAAVLALVIAPLLWMLLRNDRAPQGHARASIMPGLEGRQWNRRDAARHWLLPALLPVLLTPGFIGTVTFFHQAHIAEVKGWTLALMAPGYSVFAITTVASALVAGWATDRFGAHRLLPVLLLPMGIGITLLAPTGHVASWYAALGFIGITQGISATLWGALLPSVYGTQHLGSIRSLTMTIMVIATAIGPGITGILIDRQIDFPVQGLFMGGWCFLLAVGCTMIARRLTRELSAIPSVPDPSCP